MADRPSLAAGGYIPAPPPGDDSVPVVLDRGVCILPDQAVRLFGRELLAEMTGGGVVLTASEALAELDDEEGDRG